MAASYLSEEQIEHQLMLFKRGTNHVQLLRPAVVSDGISRLGGSAVEFYKQLFQSRIDSEDVMKFVPASGAATRMFKRIFEWIEEPEKHANEIAQFFNRAEELPFFEQWMSKVNELDIETFKVGLESQVKWLRILVSSDGIGLALLPKGLIEFHQYDAHVAIPVEEHMHEALGYAKSGDLCKLHFTVSDEYIGSFMAKVDELKKESPFNEVQWEIKFSSQEPKTDTIAVDPKLQIIGSNENPLTRPGGHGALLHNLNKLDASLVFVKNIDNVVHQDFLNRTVDYKQVLAGVLFELRDDLKVLHHQLKKGLVDEIAIQECRNKWGLRIPKAYRSFKAYLQRPIRVCGMVRNEGEPGGGPFWCHDEHTGESLQIVEQSQINTQDLQQQMILRNSSHFNPVDLVCYLQNLGGESINLEEYVDDNQYFISGKSFQGEPILALEWPGLWNGGMAHWITLFVEVPIDTFNPVKEVKDLLRPKHLVQKLGN